MSPRAELLAQHEDMVRGVATNIARELGLEQDVEDLVSSGYEGLLQADDRFDPDKGIPFAGFAYYRVRGAILDEVRNVQKLPRKALDHVRRSALCDEVSETALAERMERGPEATTESIAAAVEDLMGQLTMACVAAATADAERGSTPEDLLATQLEMARVRKAVATLPEREQRVVRAMYFEDRLLDDLGEELRVSKSMVSKIHTHGLTLLRKRLG